MSAPGFPDAYQVKVTTGILVTWYVRSPSLINNTNSDSAAKQILLHVDSHRNGPDKFILRDGQLSHTRINPELMKSG
jgi:TFIIH basal transcription factor complex TTD-A subunit